MNIFELGFLVAPIVGAVVGVQHHAPFGVGPVLGGVIGAAVGLASYFAVMFVLAAVMSLLTGKPLFRPKVERKVDDA
jgi:hypothetical protein